MDLVYFRIRKTSSTEISINIRSDYEIL